MLIARTPRIYRCCSFELWRFDGSVSPKINPSPILAAQRVNIRRASRPESETRHLFTVGIFHCAPTLRNLYLYVDRLAIYTGSVTRCTRCSRNTRAPRGRDAFHFSIKFNRRFVVFFAACRIIYRNFYATIFYAASKDYN